MPRRRIGLFNLLLFLLFFQAKAQVDHWETLVDAANTWKYFIGNSEPPATWIGEQFDDNSWNQGPGGVGYGDNDDGTSISNVVSVYSRIKFSISSITDIEDILFLADYDDGFIAYINGTEIARGGLSGEKPPFNQLADGNHEASLYQGLYPEEFRITKSDIAQLFKEGENVLAVQTHNVNTTSSDLSSNYFIIAGLNVSTSSYQPLPSWFRAPVDTESSNLPIIKIDTQGKSIPDEPKVSAYMEIIDNGPGIRNGVNNQPTDYVGSIGIELRGSSSRALFPKKQYAVELWTNSGKDTSASVLGLPAEEDWVLYAPYSDKSLIRNLLTYKLGSDLGWYAPRTKMVELFLNGFYQGVYMLTEKIKRDKNRVDISRLNPDENSGDDLTGGYIVKLDKFDGATVGYGWDSPYSPPGNSNNQVIHFQYHYPKEDEITNEQKNYIESFITDFEHVLKGPKYRNLTEGYRKYINVASFIDFAIINELTKNVDGYRLSTFLYKDRDSKDGKLYLGPIWDFNLAFGNANYCEGGKTTGWAWDFNKYCSGDHWLIPFWWERLLRDPDFVLQLQNRWNELRSNIYSNASILNYVDSVATVLDEPQQRNFEKWPVLNEYIWPNNYVGGNYANEISYLKNWISKRLSWLDNNIANLQVLTELEEKIVHNESITIFPNPSKGLVNIIVSHKRSSNLQLTIYDRFGKIVFHKMLYDRELDNKAFSINRIFAKGVYLFIINDFKETFVSKKVIIN